MTEPHTDPDMIPRAGTRVCLSCGKRVPASHDRLTPWPDCPSPDACEFDLTELEAWDYWRHKYHELRAEAEAMVAAAYEAATRQITPLLSSAIAAKEQAHTDSYETAMAERADGLVLAIRHIRSLTPDDTRAALAKMLDEARAAEREAIVDLLRDYIPLCTAVAAATTSTAAAANALHGAIAAIRAREDEK